MRQTMRAKPRTLIRRKTLASLWRPKPVHAARRAAFNPCGGMTLVELLLTNTFIAMILGGLILISQSLRNDACEQQTRSTLRQLRSALKAYHRQHNTWPQESTTSEAVKTLLSDNATASIVRPLNLGRDDQNQLCVRDGYGHPVRYVVQSRHNIVHADFISAGPDGRFGDLTSQSPRLRDDAADNLYGFDLETPTR